MIAGTQGYAEHAKKLFLRDAGMPFAEKHHAVLHLLPDEPSRILDIGAGTGADAAWFASRGHEVVAVEPTAELRLPAMALHPAASIEWIDDSLSRLAVVRDRKRQFRVIMLAAVWMHLDREERRRAMPNLPALLTRDGVVVMSLRHGPVPEGRRMFEVSAEETIRLAEDCGLRVALNVRAPSVQRENRAAGVTWTHLAFVAETERDGGD